MGVDYRVRFPVRPNYSPIELLPEWLSVREMLPGYEAELASMQRCMTMYEYVHTYVFTTELNWA